MLVFFNSLKIVCDCSPPFVIEVVTDGAVSTASTDYGAGTTDGVHRGACFDYTQFPCAS